MLDGGEAREIRFRAGDERQPVLCVEHAVEIQVGRHEEYVVPGQAEVAAQDSRSDPYVSSAMNRVSNVAENSALSTSRPNFAAVKSTSDALAGENCRLPLAHREPKRIRLPLRQHVARGGRESND